MTEGDNDMRTLYLDQDFRVHAFQAEGLVAWNDDNGMFDGKGDSDVERYRVVPFGATWARKDGVVFEGMMIALASDEAAPDGLVEALSQASRTIAELDAAIVELEVQNAMMALGIEGGV